MPDTVRRYFHHVAVVFGTELYLGTEEILVGRWRLSDLSVLLVPVTNAQHQFHCPLSDCHILVTCAEEYKY